MPFDMSTAKPASSGFDISTAKPSDQLEQDPIFFGLPQKTVAAIKSKVPDIEGWRPPANEQEAFDRKFNAGISATEDPQKSRQSEQMRLANLERIRLENPEKAKLIEGLSQSELDAIGIGRRLSTVGSGLKRLVGQSNPEEIARLQEDTEIFNELTSVQPRAEFSSNLAAVPALIAGGGAMNIASMPARVAATGVVGAAEGGIPSLGAGEDAGEAGKKAAIGAGLNVLGGEIFNIGKLSPKQLKIKKSLMENPRDPELAKYIMDGEKPVVAAKLKAAIHQTGRPDLVAISKASSPIDKAALKKMVKGIKAVNKDPLLKGVIQPRDVVGDSLAFRVRQMDILNKRAGQNIDRIARTQLKGKTVDLSATKEGFKSAMDDLRVAYDPEKGVVSFSRSALEGPNSSASRDLIKRLARDLKNPNIKATDAHFLKRMIDKQVTFGKSPSGIGGEIDQSIKDLRRGLNESIRKVSKPYEKANIKYADTIQAMDNLQSAAGSKVDLSSAKQLGLSSRRMASNAASGEQMKAAYKEIDDVLSRYGVKVKADIRTQARAAEILEERFKTQGANTFKSEAGKGVAEGLRKTNTERIIDAGGKVVDKVTGVTDDKALDALLEILN